MGRGFQLSVADEAQTSKIGLPYTLRAARCTRNAAIRQLPERLRARTQSQSVRCPEDLVAAGTHADIVRQVHPAHRAGGVN